MENITNELLLSLHKRAMEYCIVRWGREPRYLSIQEGGVFVAIYVDYYNSDRDETEEQITLSELTEGLEIAANKRAEELRKIKEEKEAICQRRKEQQKEYELRQRKALYQQLKKEFPND